MVLRQYPTNRTITRVDPFMTTLSVGPKILVTGSSGLLGSACVELFKNKGWQVIGIDNNARSKNLGTPKKRLGFEITSLDMDFTQPEEVFDLFRQHKFDAIIHAGAQASHDWSNDHVLEDFITNAMGTVLLLEATRQFCPEAVFVYVSTDKVYGENMEVIVDEPGDRYSPLVQSNLYGFKENLGLDFAGHRSPFGCSKTTGDIYAQEYAHTFGLKTGIFRPGCITGKNHEGVELHGFLAYLAKCIREEKIYKIFGFKGKQVRDQIHALDLASAFWHFIQNPRKGEVYNIGGGPERSISILEAGEAIAKKVGKPFKYEHHPERPGDRVFDVHDVSKFKSHYPKWEYAYSLDNIIDDVISKKL